LGVSVAIAALNLKGIWLYAAGIATVAAVIEYRRYWRAAAALEEYS
jgi:hypothetical protein